MSRALRDLSDAELDSYCDEVARAAEAARVVGGSLPAVIASASAGAAAETASRWGLK